MEDSGAVMANPMTEPPLRLDGMACYPFIIWPGELAEEDQPAVYGDKIREAMYSLWSGGHGSVFSKSHAAWHLKAFPEGSGDPVCDPVSTAYTWPVLPAVGLQANSWDSDTDRKL